MLARMACSLRLSPSKGDRLVERPRLAATLLPERVAAACGLSPTRKDRALAVPVHAVAALERSAGQASTSGRQESGTAGLVHQPPHIAHEIIQGALVRFSTEQAGRPPPTAVLVHGILGSRRNMQSFARRLVEGFPHWQVVLVDLRCHGESAHLSAHLPGQHSVATAAEDITRLLASLRLFPELLIGHSFGGKVVMSIAQQFSQRATTLPRPVKVWVLDALPGEVRSGEMGGQDRPADLITTLQSIRMPVSSRPALVGYLESQGFSPAVSAWAATNLAPAADGSGLVWGFDLPGIAQMYKSYESTSLWPLLAQPLKGLQISFVKAERSTFRWGGGDEERIRSLGHAVHLLPNSGHWVHSDNPDGLFDILAPSFGAEPDLHMQRSPAGSPASSPPASPRSNISPLAGSASKQLQGMLH